MDKKNFKSQIKKSDFFPTTIMVAVIAWSAYTFLYKEGLIPLWMVIADTIQNELIVYFVFWKLGS